MEDEMMKMIVHKMGNKVCIKKISKSEFSHKPYFDVNPRLVDDGHDLNSINH